MSKTKFIYWKSSQLLDEFAEREKIQIHIIFNDDGHTSLYVPVDTRKESVLYISLERVNNYKDLKFILGEVTSSNNYFGFKGETDNSLFDENAFEYDIDYNPNKEILRS